MESSVNLLPNTKDTDLPRRGESEPCIEYQFEGDEGCELNSPDVNEITCPVTSDHGLNNSGDSFFQKFRSTSVCGSNLVNSGGKLMKVFK